MYCVMRASASSVYRRYDTRPSLPVRRRGSARLPVRQARAIIARMRNMKMPRLFSLRAHQRLSEGAHGFRDK